MFKTRVLKRSHAYGQGRLPPANLQETPGAFMQGIRNIPGRQRRLIIYMKKIRDFLNKKRKGMTLIELMIVVVIIGIVFAYAFVNAGANTEKAKYARAIEDISAITSAVALYVAETGDVTTALSNTGLGKIADTKVLDKKLSKKFADMKDPWGTAYSLAVDTTAGANTVTISCSKPTTPDGEPLKRVLDFSLK